MNNIFFASLLLLFVSSTTFAFPPRDFRDVMMAKVDCVGIEALSLRVELVATGEIRDWSDDGEINYRNLHVVRVSGSRQVDGLFEDDMEYYSFLERFYFGAKSGDDRFTLSFDSQRFDKPTFRASFFVQKSDSHSWDLLSKMDCQFKVSE